MDFKSTIGYKFLLLAMGTGLGKLIVLAVMPLLTRIYEPNQFAELSLYNSIVTLLSPLVSLRLLLGIPTARDNDKALLVLKLSIVTSIVFSTIFMVFSIALHDFFPDAISSLGGLLYLLPISILVVSLIESLSMYATRAHNFHLLSKTSVYQAISESFFKVSLKSSIYPGLILGQFAQQIAGLIYLTVSQHADIKKIYNLSRSMNLWCTFGELVPIVRYRVIAQCLVSLSITMPIFFTTFYYSKDVLGQLSLAITAIALPVNLLSAGMSRVILAETCAIDEGEVRNKVRSINKLVVQVLVFGLMPALILFYIGEEMFVFVFGKQWAQAGILASVLSIIMLCEIAFSPCQQILTGLNRHKKYLYLSVLRLLVYSLSLYTGYLIFDSIEGAIYTYAISGALFFLYVYFYSIKELKNYEI